MESVKQFAARRRRVIGANIIRARGQNGLSQRKLAKILGVEQPTVYKWEHGIHSPSKSYLERIAVALSTSTEELEREHQEQAA
jgi:transcriptional regulator with XRE-family HTH domain